MGRNRTLWRTRFAPSLSLSMLSYAPAAPGASRTKPKLGTMERVIPKNPKYAAIGTVLDTGASVRRAPPTMST